MQARQHARRGLALAREKLLSLLRSKLTSKVTSEVGWKVGTPLKCLEIECRPIFWGYSFLWAKRFGRYENCMKKWGSKPFFEFIAGSSKI